jgi:methylphosphotriester-DNA--protein-cysteine methyltransferase
MTMTSPRTTRVAEDCVEDACRWIEARVLEDGDGVLVLAELADALDTRPDSLRRAFVRRLGVTPRQYADTLRRERLRVTGAAAASTSPRTRTSA